jgi:hypothetical protein
MSSARCINAIIRDQAFAARYEVVTIAATAATSGITAPATEPSRCWSCVAFSWYGENIIRESGQPAASIASHFNTWWMNSPEHRANILNTHYRHLGIGLVASGSRVYMVEDFTN